MPGFRPPPTGDQFRLFLFDLLTDSAMAHTFLFREGLIDTVDFPLWHFLILYFKGGDGIQDMSVKLFIDHTNVATSRRVTKGNGSSRGPTDPSFIGGHQDCVDVVWRQSVSRDVCHVAVCVFIMP